jgi:GAF domain-containing protein
MQGVAGGARELCGADAAWIALREAGSEAVAFRYGAGDPVLHADVRVEPGKGLGGLMLLTGGPLRTSDWAADPRFTKEYLPKVRAEGVVAEIVVPIRIGDRIEGILYAANRAPRPFTDRDEAILAQLADHAAIAMQNARLYAAAETRRRAAESLAEGRAVSQSLDHEEVGRRIVRSVCTLLRSQHCVLYRLDPGGETRAAVAIWGDASFPERWTVVPAEAGISGLALRERRSVVSGDLLTDSRLTLTPEMRAFSEATLTHRAGLAVPLVFQDRVIGTIAVVDRQGRVFSGEEIGLVEAFAEEAVLALENARLHEAALGRVRALAALVEVNRAITGTLDLHALAGAILEAARTLLPGCAGKFWEMLPGGETLRIVEHRGFATALGTSVTGVGVGQGLTGIAAQTRALVTSPDVRRDERVLYPERMVEEGLVSAIVLPLLHAGTFYGTLNLFTRAPHVFTADEMGLLESFAAQAAVAIMNARLYAHASAGGAEGLAELGRLWYGPWPRGWPGASRTASSRCSASGLRRYRLDGRRATSCHWLTPATMGRSRSRPS